VAADPRAAVRAAHVLGATQEARRLACRLVGTEHLLMATMADPAVRAALLHRGRDLREVQRRVTAISDARQARHGPLTLSPRAEQILVRVVEAEPALDAPDGFVGPAERSRGLLHLLACLRTGPADTSARQVLSELGLAGRRPWSPSVDASGPSAACRP
jgi:hypothetical protein